MPGRRFVSPADFNGHFAEWLADANGRVVRTLKARPADLVAADREAMLALPPVPPVVGWSNQVRLGRDYYVRVDSNDYSVDPAHIGRLVTVSANLERVLVLVDRLVVADHARVWARHVTVTDTVHLDQARRLRDEFARPRGHLDEEALVWELADYDRSFGLANDGEEVA